jgi:hypothetical protein
MENAMTVLSVISTVCAIVFGYIAFVRNRDSDKTKEAKSDATILTELGYIKGGIDDVKAEQREQRKTNTDFVGRLVSVEASAKQAHKRIDHIEQQMNK